MQIPRSALDRDPERLVRDYADLVLRVCYTYLRSTADADDVCQDTLVKLICRDEPFHDPGHERAWVIRVAINACRNLLRDRGAHPAVGLDDVPEPAAAQAPGEDALRRRDERVLAAAAAKSAEKNVQPGAPAEILIMPACRLGCRRTHRWARVATGLALALVLGGGGTVAVAAGVLPNPADVLSDVFGGAPAQTELLNEVGRPIGASATSNGVTVTAEAVVGDRSNYAVVYSIEFDDPSVLDRVEPSKGGTLPLVFDAMGHVDGTMGGAGVGRFYDDDPGDNVIQYAETSGFTTWNGAGIIGRTMRLSIREIRVYDATEDRFVTLVTGDWDLKFEMNYVDTTVDLPAGQETTWHGAGVTVDAVAVSSVGVMVDYTIDRQIGDLGSSGQLSDEAEVKIEAVTGLPVTVTLADGTTLDTTNASTYVQEERDDGTSAVTTMVTYDRIVAVGDIVSVTVGDAEIPVSAE